MTRALELVALGKMGVNRAALKCGVPATTLKDWVSIRVARGSEMGPKPYLTYEEEEELVTFLTNCSKMGYDKTGEFSWLALFGVDEVN